MRLMSTQSRLVTYINIIKVNKIDVSFSCVCLVVDREFRHNIVEVAVDPRGDLLSLVDASHRFMCLSAY